MRMSCNGCRVLRKGCSESCSIRPCLQWIKSPESQANATVFLAKFYGRAGLMNLINAGPEHLRPAIFRSLLYEACGRIVNPIYGSVGLLWSGSWQLCQDAVEAVLKGAPITPINTEAAAINEGPPLKAYDIRHVSKEGKSAVSNDLQRSKTRCRFKRSVAKPKLSLSEAEAKAKTQLEPSPEPEPNLSTSHDSSLSHQSEHGANLEGDSKEMESMVSEGTAEPSLLSRADIESGPEVGLELTLGLEPVARVPHVVPVKKRRFEECGSREGGDACKMGLGL